MRTRLAAAVLAVGTAGLGFVPLASAATTGTVAPTVESWFQPNPSCSGPAGCLGPGALPVAAPVEPPTNPFPAETLHVAVSAGQETARTYLGLPSSALAGATSAQLQVPLDVAPGSGGMAPESAKVQVCLTRSPLAPVRGSFAEPPAADCAARATAAYVATPLPHLEADLAPLVGGLAAATGLVLLPDATALAPSDAWRVVFSTRARDDAAKTPPPTLLVVTADAPAPVPVDVPQAPAAPALEVVDAPVFQESSVPAPEPELGGPVAAVDLPAPDPAPQAAGEAVPVEQVAFPQTVRVGYAYPIVWLLPLVLLLVVPLVARVLTRDLTPGAAGPDTDVTRAPASG